MTANGEQIILSPNMQITVRSGKSEVMEIADATQSIGWTQNKFIFVGVPLKDVVQEIERQYNIRVITSSNLDHLYTGNFAKPNDPEEALQIIGGAFSITFDIKR